MKYKNIQKVTWEIGIKETSKKPKVKNLFFCPQCYRGKLKFETLKEAEDNIWWNSNDIYRQNGRAPVRAYWCSSCGCYHTTSRPSVMHGGSSKVNNILDIITDSIISTNIEESRKLIEKAYKEVLDLNKSYPDGSQRLASKVLIAIQTIDRREFDEKIKESEYLIRIKDYSGAENTIQWLEAHNLNPDKVERLRQTLIQFIQ